MDIVIKPSSASGIMEAPPSKSMAHRLLICAALAEGRGSSQTILPASLEPAVGRSVITGVDLSEDILATMDCLRTLGAEVTYSDSVVTVRGADVLRGDTEAEKDARKEAGSVPGTDDGKDGVPVILPCRECGSTLRFLIPVCLLGGRDSVFTGSGKLMARPLSVYEKICKEQGILYRKEKDSLLVKGKLSPGLYEIPGNISSQFVSGLLFALPLLERESRIRLLPPLESLSYIRMTMQALDTFGVRAVWEDDHTILVPGGQKYEPRNVRVEGDCSNAAFFAALNLIGGDVVIKGLREDTLQGDRLFPEYFRQLEVGFAQIDIADCPDLGPILIAAAALLHGARLTGTARLKLKESDRGESMRMELAKMGTCVEVMENEILVNPGVRPPEVPLNGHGDHRIAMSLAVLLSQTGGTLTGAEAVSKSLPDFFERLKRLGIEAEQID